MMSTLRSWFNPFLPRSPLRGLFISVAIASLLPGVAAASPDGGLPMSFEPPSLDTKDARPRQEAEEMGLKSFPIQTALRLLATAIRFGGGSAEKLRSFPKGDTQAEKAFQKHGNKIADYLNTLANPPDINVYSVKERVRKYLKEELHLLDGTAGVIVEAVNGALIGMT